ncbi:type I pantothenate kinase [Alphaproteobacteria bacterium]|nr:type I pantothenate kinase [Alphaproteobacteria bacterium]MDC0148639.1 type I pantothenate kinase [Alphaproteobacteria bacterium]
MFEGSSIEVSPYRSFSALEWGRLRKDAKLTLTEQELEKLRGLGETISLAEVEEIYLPLSRLLNLYVEAAQNLYGVTNEFLGREIKVPFIIGVAGSVAVGKSTTSRILRDLLASWPSHPKVDLITTDGFLFPNAVLEERGLMQRKGFPESFDLRSMRRFLADVKSGQPEVIAPVYSHEAYDIITDGGIPVSQPDILIVEGLNVLQPALLAREGNEIPFVSDYFDFSIYIDADAETIERWYIERFMSLRQTAFREPGAYFRRYVDIGDDEAEATAHDIWRRINLTNLLENILPTRGRADLILHKGNNHQIDRVQLRKI